MSSLVVVVAVAVIVAVADADAVVAGSDVVVVAGVAKKTADSFRGY